MLANFKLQHFKKFHNKSDVLRPISRKTYWLLYVSSAMVLFALPGCGASTKEIGRLPVSGTVVRENSDSAVNGSISFLPKEKGPAATTQITNGEYQFNQQNGPISGEYRVQVSTQTGMNQANATSDTDEAKAVLSKVNSNEWTFSILIPPDAQELKPFGLDAKNSSQE